MQEVRPPELLDRLKDYVESELSSRRKVGEGKLLLSRMDFTALMRLYSCAWKNQTSLEGLKNSGDKDITQSVGFILKVLEIDDFAGLVEWASKVKHYAELLAKIELEGKKAVSRQELTSLVRLKDLEGNEARFNLSAIMSVFCDMCSDNFTLKKTLAEYISLIHTRHAKPLYEMLLLTLAPKRSRRSAKSESDSQSQKADSDSPDSTDSPETPVSPETAALLEQIDTLKAELEGAYIRLNSSEENYDILQREGKEAAMNDVLALMNSPASGMLIDQFAKCEQTLKTLAEKGVHLPEEYSSLSLCVRIFMRTMRNVFGVTPVLELGKTLKINLDQSLRYIYTGSEFENAEERKKVKVTSPGWIRKGEIFSPPQVMEC